MLKEFPHRATPMGIREEENVEKKTKNVKEMRNRTKGVFISIYVESPTIRIRSYHTADPIKRIKPNPFSSKPRSVRTQGYDRRAQLLAYARELRHANSHPSPQCPQHKSMPNPNKKWRWLSSSSSRLRLSLSRLFCRRKWRWRYQHIVSDESSKVDQSCGPKRIRSKSRFWKRLRCKLKELSCGWHCNKV